LTPKGIEIYQPKDPSPELEVGALDAVRESLIPTTYFAVFPFFTTSKEQQELRKLRQRLARAVRLRWAALESPPRPPSERQLDILQVLFERKAFDEAHRITTEATAKAAANDKDWQADSWKRPVKDLKARGLIDTKIGSRGGCWLTKEGQSFIKKARHL
jgi:hypothetical protein